jgi:hypothetical protein
VKFGSHFKMFNLFRNKTDLKGFKVCTNAERNKKYGIAADSLEALVQKIKNKFDLDEFELFFDGTCISDENFFRVIPSNSQIVIVTQGEEYKTGNFVDTMAFVVCISN